MLVLELSEGKRRMARFGANQNPLDTFLALRRKYRREPTQIIKKCLYHEFPVIPIIRQQRTIGYSDRVLRDIPLLIKVARDIMADNGDLDGEERPLNFPPDTSLLPDLVETLTLNVSRTLSPPARAFVLHALQDYERAGRIAPIQAAALEEVRNTLSGPGEQPENLFRMLQEHQMTSPLPGGTQPFLSLQPVRTWVMAHYYRENRDTHIWALLHFLETRGQNALLKEATEKGFQFDREYLAGRMNAARIGVRGNFRWTNQGIKDLGETIRKTVLPKLKEQLSKKLAAE